MGCILHHDSSLTLSVLLMIYSIANLYATTVKLPPYFEDPASADLNLFPELKG